MNSDNTALVNKLILLVLTLILVCLVLIVVRAYSDRKSENTRLALAGVGTSIDESPDGEIAPASPTPPIRRPLTNQVRFARAVTPSPPTSTKGLDDQQSLEPPSSGADGFHVVTGIGVLPGASAGADGLELLAQATNGAELIGIATLLGMPKPEVLIDLGPSCGKLNPKRVTTRHYVVNSAGQLANVFVYIGQGLSSHFAVPSKPVLLDQVGCLFEPYVFGLQTGQKLQVRNSDPEFHNIHTTPRLNPESNFAQPGKSPVVTLVFKKPEIFLRFKCDVHPWMFSYACVVEHPFASVTDTNGVFRLPSGLPAGRYTLTATHLKAGTLAQEFEYRPGEPKAFAFQFVVPDATQAQSSGRPNRALKRVVP
jgi:hypothetical protein